MIPGSGLFHVKHGAVASRSRPPGHTRPFVTRPLPPTETFPLWVLPPYAPGAGQARHAIVRSSRRDRIPRQTAIDPSGAPARETAAFRTEGHGERHGRTPESSGTPQSNRPQTRAGNTTLHDSMIVVSVVGDRVSPGPRRACPRRLEGAPTAWVPMAARSDVPFSGAGSSFRPVRPPGTCREQPIDNLPACVPACRSVRGNAPGT